MKLSISVFLFLFIVNINKAQSDDITWSAEVAFTRDSGGNINLGKHFATLNFTFSSKTTEIIVFNYHEIYEEIENAPRCFKETSNFWQYLSDTLAISHMFIENQDSMLISLYENRVNPSFIYNIYHLDCCKEYDYSIFQLSSDINITEQFRYPIPIVSLDVCKKSTKLRLIYLQYPNGYMKKLGIKKRILVSEWFDVTHIK